MRHSWRATLVKFSAFVIVMVLVSAFLVFIFGQYQTGPTTGYSAVFADVSRLKPGDTVRVAGIRVGTVKGVSLRDDKKVVVTFDADRSVVLTTGTRAMVRYLNLVGDRYLELVDGPGSTTALPVGSQIPVDRTAPALDLDLLLGGLKPVIQGLNPQDVNALSASLIDIFQGQGGTIESLFANTSSFTNALADHNQVIQQLIDNLRSVLKTLAAEGQNFSGAIDRLERLVTELAADRDPIGEAIESLNNGTASIADLLTEARPPLAGTVDELNRLAPNLEGQKDRLDTALQKAPEDYRKLARLGAYGSFVNYYICKLWVRVSDVSGRTAVFPAITQEGGRCTEPDA
ncbi:MCE family protein [Mycobacterium sp.]|jgi:phospholipid/cholesterol/gamma-HCH transport system substrate-binding protein|uniref:MCE family protein n=1 Tax=Mycobacterium sp. TaxID=1785 RepID=UPI003C735679